MAIQTENMVSKSNLQAVWNKISDLFVRKETGKGLSANDFTDTLKTKLDGIEAGANAYTHPTHTAAASGLYKVTVDSSGHVSATTAVAKADITALGIPAQDTTYSVFTGATNNDDGTTGLVPSSSAGANTRYLRVDGTWVTPPDTDTTYSVATNVADGLMSSTDFVKLAGIETGATNTTVDNAMSDSSTNPVQNSVIKTYVDGQVSSAISTCQGYTDTAVTSAYRYIGSVADATALAAVDTTNLAVGSVYNIVAESTYGAPGMNVAWNGTGWDNLGGSFSISALTTEEITAICV